MHRCRRLFSPYLAVSVGLQAIIVPAIALAQTESGSPLVLPLTLPSITLEDLEARLIEGMDRGIKGDYLGAIAIFSELIRRYPDYADAYFNRGIARAKLQDYQGAIADQSQAIALKPDDAEAYQARAKVQWQLGNNTQAIADLQMAIMLFQKSHNTISQTEAETLLKYWLRAD